MTGEDDSGLPAHVPVDDAAALLRWSVPLLAEAIREKRVICGVVAREDWTGTLVTIGVESDTENHDTDRFVVGRKDNHQPTGFWYLSPDDAYQIVRDGRGTVKTVTEWWHRLRKYRGASLHFESPLSLERSQILVARRALPRLSGEPLLSSESARLPLEERRLVPFDKAFARLRERFPDTTVGEVVMWVDHCHPFADDTDLENRLFAYRRALLPGGLNGRESAALYGSGFITHDTTSSLYKIHDLFFLPKALEIFKPKVRWLSYEQLTARWGCDESLIAKRICQTGSSPFEFWPHPLYQDAPLSESMFLIERVEKIEKRFDLADHALQSATAPKTFTSETGEVLLRARNTYPVGLLDNYQHYRRLDDHPKPDHLDLQARDGSLRIAVKAHRWRAYLVPGNPDSSQSTMDEYGWSRDGGPPKGSAPLLIEGFWYLEGQEAARVLSGDECRVNWLLPTDSAELHRRWPDLFPEGEFHLDLEKWMQFEREDLLWLDESSESETKPTESIPVSQGESGKSKQSAVVTRQIALVEAENAALAALRKELKHEPNFEEFWCYIIERDDTGTITDHTDDRLMWTGRDGRDCETARSTMRNRLAAAKKRNPFNPSS